MIVHVGAEGETAPETLRPMDRWKMILWKAIFRLCGKSTDGGSPVLACGGCAKGCAGENSQVTGQRGQGVALG
jgi:hypothetical protein